MPSLWRSDGITTWSDVTALDQPGYRGTMWDVLGSTVSKDWSSSMNLFIGLSAEAQAS